LRKLLILAGFSPRLCLQQIFAASLDGLLARIHHRLQGDVKKFTFFPPILAGRTEPPPGPIKGRLNFILVNPRLCRGTIKV